MTIDQHFRVVGVQRGCSMEDVKKAFRQKALVLHPDRNPQGGDAFKQLNESYEALTVHFKDNHGKDNAKVDTFFTGSSFKFSNFNNGSYFSNPQRRKQNYGSASTTPTHSSSPLFNDDELFNNTVPGGWTHGTKPKPSEGETSNPELHRVDQRWRRAHGSRVPVSSYSTATASSRYTGSSGIPEYKKDEKPFTIPPFSSLPHTLEELKFLFDQLYAKNEYVKKAFNSEEGHCSRADLEAFELIKDDRMRLLWDKLKVLTNDDLMRKVLREAWMSEEEALQEKLDALNRAASEKAHAEAQARARNEALAEERRRLAAIEEATRKVREERCAKAKQLAEEMAQALRREKDELHQDNLLEDKRQLLKMMLRLQYSPDPADVGDMTDVEVYLLRNIMEDVSKKVDLVFTARMERGPCSRCKLAPKAKSCRDVFRCEHACVCSECALRSSQCPLCGAARKVLLTRVEEMKTKEEGGPKPRAAAGEQRMSSCEVSFVSSLNLPTKAGAQNAADEDTQQVLSTAKRNSVEAGRS